MNFKKPDFLFCEIPVKDDSFNDERLWVYHLNSLSLIEFVNVDSFADFNFDGEMERFEYCDENWFGVFTQNNCEATGQNSEIVLQNAWQFLKEYLIWEDKNIDNNL